MSTGIIRPNSKFTSKAPSRIDLAGGTIDLWPLYMFFGTNPYPCTINYGIDIFAEAEFSSTSGEGKVTLESRDQDVREHWSIDELAQGKAANSKFLILHQRILTHYLSKVDSSPLRKLNLKLSSQAKSPAGAGLGGSSTLAISLSGLITHALGIESSLHDLVETMKDIEADILKTPTGTQDYRGAAHGGLQALEWNAGGMNRFSWEETKQKHISDRTILFYSGKSRNSGMNNWLLYKRLLDGDSHIRSCFEEIAKISVEMKTAIDTENWQDFEKFLKLESAIRVKLAPEITTDEIESCREAFSKLGVQVLKICGAGGGGCFFAYHPDLNEELRKKIVQAGDTIGVSHLPFQPSYEGLQIKEVSS